MSEPSSALAPPLVSVVIPTYNRVRYICETIESVLAQTYPNIEIFVIDDGSTDDTRAVLERFGPKINYVWQENSERGASRNHGLRLAGGKYVSFLDSDDVWLPGKIAADVAILEAEPYTGLVFSDALQIDQNGAEIGILRAGRVSGSVTARIIERNCVAFSTQMARTDLVRQIGGFNEDRQLSGAEDWELLVRLSTITSFAFNPMVTTKIRTHPDNTMNDAAAMLRATSHAGKLIRESADLASAYPRSIRRMEANLSLGNAINHCSIGAAAATIGYLREAVGRNPAILLDWRFAYTIFRLLRNRLRSASDRDKQCREGLDAGTHRS